MQLPCVCCGETYARGHYRCCATPNGMASHRWLELFCRGEHGCGKCPKHCQCPNKRERLSSGGLRQLVSQFIDHPEAFGLPAKEIYSSEKRSERPGPPPKPRLVVSDRDRAEWAPYADD